MSRLRGFQPKLVNDVDSAWNNGAQNVLLVAPCGSGKTVMAAHIANSVNARAGCIIAHRRDLVTQISLAYAREGLPHDIIGQPNTIHQVRTAHLEEFGKQFVDPSAKWKVASVDTLINLDINKPQYKHWFANVNYVFIDEGHHVLKMNKWGAAFSMFPSKMRGLLLTATPDRADGMGLGSHADGIADVMVEGPDSRSLVDDGYLTDYKVWGVMPDDLDLGNVNIGKDGDFIAEQMRKAVKKSNKIVGDVVRTYMQYAWGKLGVTFAASVDDCYRFAAAFNAAGVPAAVITADTLEEDRRRILRDFKNKKLWQLINVDLFGEGFDLPAITCVSMARPTFSFSLYTQQWQRAQRLLISPVLLNVWDIFTGEQRKQHIAESEKPFAMIFDHVGNVLRHRGPPDKYRPWSLDRRERGTRISDKLIPQRYCLGCSMPYERTEIKCPYCGEEPDLIPLGRSSPHLVDGDPVLYSDELLKQLRGEADRIAGPIYIPNAQKGTPAEVAIFRRHVARQLAIRELTDTINLWAGAHGEHEDRVNYRRFYHIFGTDVLTAMTLNAEDAQKLKQRVEDNLNEKIRNFSAGRQSGENVGCANSAQN